MGCGIRVASAVSWALSKFERVIVLEDDCIPSSSFFFYCEQLLEKYCLDERVMHVGGFNFQPGKTLRCASYYFSKYPLASGGWATWRRAWRHYDWRMKAWPDLKERGVVAGWCPDPLEAEYWTKLFDGVHNGAADVWDYQWNLACWAHGGLSILPTVQLLSNVGFGIDATHTKDPISHLQAPPGEIRKMFHPDQVQQDYELDKFIFDNCFGGALMRHSRSLWVKVRSSVVRALPWLRRLRAVVR